MEIEITRTESDGTVDCKISGELNIYQALDIRNSFLEILKNHSKIHLDFSEVIDFDSAALQILIGLKREAKAQNKKLRFYNHSDSVLKVLDLFGMLSFFEDKISLNRDKRKEFSFQYGTKKLPNFLKL
ncbi:MAG: STAS domain-containing protein [Leptospiraceae bacterium]|nr:STAS domain-containing protein [Leptospiraceae bacterium]